MSTTLLRAAATSTLLLGLALAGPCPSASAEGERPPGGVALKDFLRGKLVSFKGRRVEVAYDFQDPAQEKDWMPAYPFLRPAASGGFRVEGKALRGDGNAGWRHRAVFDSEVRLAATLSSEDAKNFGAVVISEDSTTYDLFSLADTFFSLLDRKPPLQHMVTTFLTAGDGPGGSTEWRYVQTGYEPRISGAPLDIVVRKKGPLNEFRFAGAGKLGGNDKEARVGPRLAAGFYTLGSRVVVTKATLSGVLDAAWLRAQNILFEDSVPDDPDPLEGERKPEGPAPEARPAGGAEWNDLARKVGNTALPKEDREKAAEALVETKERRALRSMIDLMYADEDPLGRELGNRVFKGISGKETGFRADVPREVRVKAMPRVWEIWYAVKDQIEREEKKGKEK